jgi:hypothetical protein
VHLLSSFNVTLAQGYIDWHWNPSSNLQFQLFLMTVNCCDFAVEHWWSSMIRITDTTSYCTSLMHNTPTTNTIQLLYMQRPPKEVPSPVKIGARLVHSRVFPWALASFRLQSLHDKEILAISWTLHQNKHFILFCGSFGLYKSSAGGSSPLHLHISA